MHDKIKILLIFAISCIICAAGYILFSAALGFVATNPTLNNIFIAFCIFLTVFILAQARTIYKIMNN